MATFDPSGAARQLPFRRGAMRGVQRIVRYRRECALPHLNAVNVAETYIYIPVSIHVITIPQRPSTHPPVGGGVLDAPWAAILYGVIWVGKGW